MLVALAAFVGMPAVYRAFVHVELIMAERARVGGSVREKRPEGDSAPKAALGVVAAQGLEVRGGFGKIFGALDGARAADS